ncbi:MAG: hypothetical protein JXR86_02185 [Spirochaetales bacterium]|nr:hypothetical protein [Spirochaetales bacterium]
MKRIFLTSLIISTALFLYGQSVHFGTTAVSGDDEFKSYYSEERSTGSNLGASNSFPVNTIVTVTNPGNGKAVSVTIVKRLRSPGLFLVLSPEAGEALSFPEKDVLDLQVVENRINEEALTDYAEDRAFSRDPDVNPSAELAEAVEETLSEPVLTGPAVTEETVPEEVQAIDATEAAVESPADFTDEIELASIPAESDSIEPEADIDEYIPPVVLDSEGSFYETGYDPLVLLESGEKMAPAGDEESVLQEELPLPEEFSDSDLPETFEPDWPAEQSDIAEEPVSPIAEEPVITLESEDLESDLFNPSVDDLLIFEPVKPENEETGTGLADADVSEPAVGELPENLRETIVMVPDLGIEPEILETAVLNEPFVSVPVTEELEEPEVISYIPDDGTGSSGSLNDDIALYEPEENIEFETFPDEPAVIEMEEDFVEVAEVPEKKPEKKPEKEKAPAVVEEILVPVPEEVGEVIVAAPAEETEPFIEREELTMTSPVEEPEGNVIYFLTPGDFRPPPKSEVKPEPDKVPEEKTVEPKMVERSELEHLIVRELHNGGSYLQLGTYSDVEVLYSTIKSINESYPAIVLTMGSGNNQLYKLLIGPITRDEKGIVVTRFRSLGYGDAFLYSPH